MKPNHMASSVHTLHHKDTPCSDLITVIYLCTVLLFQVTDNYP